MMVGRDRELKILTKLAASDQPRVALIAGEPGIGKTRLINELRVGHAEPGSLSHPYERLPSLCVEIIRSTFRRSPSIPGSRRHPEFLADCPRPH